MNTLINHKFALTLLNCLISLHLSNISPAYAQSEEVSHLKSKDQKVSTLAILTTGTELATMMDLSVRVMLHKTFYKLINDTFGSVIQSVPAAKNHVSQSKIIFLLSKTKEFWPDIEKYLKKIPEDNANEPDIKALKAKFDDIFDKIINDKKLLEIMRTNGSVSQPLLIVDKRSKDSYKDMEFYANHPRKETNVNGITKIIPADNHLQIMIDFVNSAKAGDQLHFNFYDFDLGALADAFIEAHKRGVEVLGGVDKKVVESKAAATEVYKKLIKAKINIEAVDSTGLNHQKIIALISEKGDSRTLMSSGNPTQSCSGPEGDLVNVPADLRPKNSIPNPNNMIIVEGDLPAVIATAEIRKNIVYKLRGQNEFPIGGAFQLLGPKRQGFKSQDWMIMTFSPNGGLGDINRDIYSKVLKLSSGPIYGAFFSFSSKSLALELSEKIVEQIKLLRKQKKPAMDLIKFVGDTRFAMRDFSVLLRLSGYRMVEYDPEDPMKPLNNTTPKDPEEYEAPIKKENVKVYIEDLADPISKPIRDLLTREEWKNFRQNIRNGADWFKESSFEYDGKKYPLEVKLHDKLLVAPNNYISNPGSSVNFSEAGEANQEQIAIVFSEYITRKTIDVINFLFDTYSNEDRSVAKEVERRNRDVTPEQMKIALKVFKERQKLEEEKISKPQNKQSPGKNLQGLTCPMVFAK